MHGCPLNRRSFLAAVAACAIPGSLSAAFAEDRAPLSIRGRLRQSGSPALVSDGRAVKLLGDEATMKVLNDSRIADSDFEALGRWLDESRSGSRFEVEKIHTRSMFVHKDGKRLMITYWCDVCYIRTYSPGLCWCCQKNTDLELLESVND